MQAKLILLFLHLTARLPLPAVHAFGTFIGRLLAIFPNDVKRVSQRNVALCFPEKSAAEQYDLVNASLIETGKAITEAGPLWLWSPERIQALVTDTVGLDELRAAIHRGQGAIIVAPHLGAWEMTGLYLSTLHAMTSLYRPPKMPEIEGLMCRGRQKFGATLVPTSASGIRALFKALNTHELVGILPDQDPGRGNGIYVPFFGIAANTMTLVARLAIKSRCPVFFVFAERLPRGRGYRIHCQQGEESIGYPPLEQATAAINRGVEECVRIVPEQYQWSYKRFKNRPEGQERFY
jgi:KDO2-lipid IV(A) lauroyltransferase